MRFKLTSILLISSLVALMSFSSCVVLNHSKVLQKPLKGGELYVSYRAQFLPPSVVGKDVIYSPVTHFLWPSISVMYGLSDNFTIGGITAFNVFLSQPLKHVDLFFIAGRFINRENTPDIAMLFNICYAPESYIKSSFFGATSEVYFGPYSFIKFATGIYYDIALGKNIYLSLLAGVGAGYPLFGIGPSVIYTGGYPYPYIPKEEKPIRIFIPINVEFDFPGFILNLGIEIPITRYDLEHNENYNKVYDDWWNWEIITLNFSFKVF